MSTQNAQTAEDGNAPPATRSKQERIRDNQRRSRARRQEYLNDLEKRLSDCHTTCREANLQRDSYTQLQRENNLLRQLLVYAGVSPGLIESYVLQGMTPAQQECASSLRRIKPKMSDSKAESSTIGMSDNLNRQYTAEPQTYQHSSPFLAAATPPTSLLRTTGCGPPLTSMAAPEPKLEDYLNYSPSAEFMGSSNSIAPLIADSSNHQSNPDWLFQTQPGGFPPPQELGTTSHNNQSPLSLALNAGIGTSDSNVLYSVTKNLIDRYSITGGEMEDIKARLQPNTSISSLSANGHFDQDHDFDQRMLFEVANELSRKYN